MVALPLAECGASGVVTFIVSHSGKVQGRDLGKDSAAVGARVMTFDPGAGWQEAAHGSIEADRACHAGPA
jgi:hypothetical protein